MSAELEIPDAAYAAADEAAADHVAGSDAMDSAIGSAVRAAVPLIVAAELDRLADELVEGCGDYIASGADPVKVERCRQIIATAQKIRARAAELRGAK